MIRRILIFLVLAFLSSNLLIAQSVNQIKSQKDVYIWGEGKGYTLREADQLALDMLINQISTTVESRYTMLREELTGKGRGEDYYKEKFKAVVNTYSNATLNNTERLVLGNEPDAHVFRYIKRSEIDKIFKRREQMIKDLVTLGISAEHESRIADALRNFYWALSLLKSHPDGSALKYNLPIGNTTTLATWLPEQMNQIFGNLHLAVMKAEQMGDIKRLLLRITYKGKKAGNLDYAFWDGRDWSNIYSARDGLGYVDLMGQAKDIRQIKLKIEYLYEGEARSNKEVERVLSKMPMMPFRKSYITIPVTPGASDTEAEKATAQQSGDKSGKPEGKQAHAGIKAPLIMESGTSTYQNTVNAVMDLINQKNYKAAEKYCTPEGYDMFSRLIGYGNATTLQETDLQFMKLDSIVYCREQPMAFQFKSNNRKFVEDVIFQMNDQGKISGLSFSLSEKALEDIWDKTNWDKTQRSILVTFLENYKTAYALKRLDYIESIFADDALIITGTKVKVAKSVENNYKNHSIIKYNRKTKDEYIRDLGRSFRSKEYINLKFEESQIRSSGSASNIYGIQIKQHYFSNNYGDTGYLFLMVDLSDIEKPIIHVRTWQPKKHSDGTVYGVGDFF